MTVSADDFPANPPEKAGYILEFQDEFSGDLIWQMPPVQFEKVRKAIYEDVY